MTLYPRTFFPFFPRAATAVSVILVLVACACQLRQERREHARAPEGWEVVEAEPSYEGWAHAVRDPRTGIVFLLVEPGTFPMGSLEPGRGWLHERSAIRRAEIARPFYLGRTELTQAQWERWMGSNPSRFQGADRPVERVSWNDAMTFCRMAGYRLPTEAEWEYACRAGRATRFDFGDDEDEPVLGQYAWLHCNSGSGTQPVGRKRPNAWGFHDMLGNVAEWCSERSAEADQGPCLRQDAADSPSGARHPVRGGSWRCGSADPADRDLTVATATEDDLGFRVARSLP